MAHADYLCCAVCDRRMSGYTVQAPEVPAKSELCPVCVLALSDLGYRVTEVSQLIELFKNKFLGATDIPGYQACYYTNDVDKAAGVPHR